MLFWGIIIFLVLWMVSLQENQRRQAQYIHRLRRDIENGLQTKRQRGTIYNSNDTINYDYCPNGHDN